ncbi:MAG: AMP-binding protein, partial [bacterium]|nr:AMP-binding protein [bacterium]
LLNGAALVFPKSGQIKDVNVLHSLILKHNVTIFGGSPLLLNQLNAVAGENNTMNIRAFICGGDVLKPDHISHFLRKATVYNSYGPTEATIAATFYPCSSPLPSNIPIGKPISNYRVYILDRYHELLPVGVPGECCIAGAGVSRGYMNRPELTREKFEKRKFELPLTLYHTGDLARWLDDGNIEFLGRIDHQVKIRGFRIETGEIENRLLQDNGVREAVVSAREDNQRNKYLCAYIVSAEKDIVSRLRERLARDLPGYMVPSYFVMMDAIPLTSHGKVNRKALPEPRSIAGEDYVAPGNPLETRLVKLWSRVLDIEESVIGVHADFFRMGGHSLNATVLIAKVHKTLGVQVPLTEIFNAPTVRGMARYIKHAKTHRYVDIEAVEKKDYYPLSPAQKRLYILRQMDLEGCVYNMPAMMKLEKSIDEKKLTAVLKQLIERHESLRTSFSTIDDQPVQRVHDEVEFEIEFFGRGELIRDFIRPFDLARPPLFRAGIIRTAEGHDIFMVDMHHIISDGVSLNILTADFISLYTGMTLEPLKLQYRDFSEWNNGSFQKEQIETQRQWWLEQFEEEVPILNLPIDYPRPRVRSFEGAAYDSRLSLGETRDLKALALENNTTLFMVLLTLTNILLAKLSGQEDIIIGTPVAGRRHDDLEKIIGMFVNTLALRNYPDGGKSVRTFLQELNQRSIEAFENQEYPFEELVDNLDINRDAGRNPVFDVMFSLVDTGMGLIAATGPDGTAKDEANIITPLSLGDRDRVSKFDLSIEAVVGETLSFEFEYSTALFKQETIQRFARYFEAVARSVTRDIEGKLSSIRIITEEEREQVLIDFNNTRQDHSNDQTARQLFQRQVEKSPYGTAAVFEDHYVTYSRLNCGSNHLATQLRGRGVMPGAIIAIMAERSLEMLTGIMG